jgi:hypothetical protein
MVYNRHLEDQEGNGLAISTLYFQIVYNSNKLAASWIPLQNG